MRQIAEPIAFHFSLWKICTKLMCFWVIYFVWKWHAFEWKCDPLTYAPRPPMSVCFWLSPLACVSNSRLLLPLSSRHRVELGQHLYICLSFFASMYIWVYAYICVINGKQFCSTKHTKTLAMTLVSPLTAVQWRFFVLFLQTIVRFCLICIPLYHIING